MVSYPWWSVDSTTWTKCGAFGGIWVPRKKGGVFIYDEPAINVKVSLESPTRVFEGQHYKPMRKGERAHVDEWLKLINVPMGENNGEEIITKGVINSSSIRKVACLLFYERMAASLPQYPWPFHSRRKDGKTLRALLSRREA
mgnify:FL=1